jgi:Zn-dependent protease
MSGGMNLLLVSFGNVDWLQVAILIPLVLLSLVPHELAHGWIAYRLGDPTAKRAGRLSFNPIRHLDPLGTAMFFITYVSSGWLFGWAKPVPVSPYYFKNRQRGMAIVGVAGPITNFILAIILILVIRWTHPYGPGWTGALLDGPLSGFTRHLTMVGKVLFLAFQLNVVLGLFNLIPVPPLDGSRVLGAFLPRRAYEKWAEFDRYGMLVALVLIIMFRTQFSRLMEWAIMGLAHLFLG